MTDASQYTADEERAIREAARRGEKPVCPRCSVVLTPRDIGGGSFGLGYARRREWLICGSCHRSVLFDRKRGTRN
ncbi:MAG TPA: hypothetical protein VF128_01070 [Gemmatimonadaceae bacterium]